MKAEIFAIMTASVLGSWHCGAMCGPFALLSSNMDSKKGLSTKTASAPHIPKIAYHLGRLCAYSILTVLIHFLAMPISAIIKQYQLQNLAAIATVFLLGSWWVAMMFARPKASIKSPKISHFLMKLALSAHGTVRAFLVGLSSSFLPCAWLYGFIVLIGAQNSWEQMFLLLLAFWVGTLPVLFGIQFFGQRFKFRLGSHFKLGAVTIVALVSLYQIYERTKALSAGAPTCHHSDQTDSSFGEEH